MTPFYPTFYRPIFSKKFFTISNRIKKHVVLALILALWIVPQLAFADGESPASQGLGYIFTAMFGATGVAICSLALMGVFLACLGHIFEWKVFVYTVLGICGVFGSPAIVKGIKALITIVSPS